MTSLSTAPSSSCSVSPILSIQSHVALGHVGNGAAVPALLAAGFAPWAIPTAVLAHHPGRGGFVGRITPAAEVAALVAGVAALPEFPSCVGVLSGYAGDPGTPEAMAGAVDALRRVRSGAPYLCDPVLGELGQGLYVHGDLPERMGRLLLPRATVVTPNPFELALLTGRAAPPATPEEALEAARDLRARGPEVVVVTGLRLGGGEIGVLLVDGQEPHLSRQDFVTGVESVKGTGDLLAAWLMAHLARTPVAGMERRIDPGHLDSLTERLGDLLRQAHRLGTPEIPFVGLSTCGC
ncbi:pyridoxal kinase [Rhodospirillum sp. A1_3_36]|uniref:pyridoxal kinase n=1 Tax=Rhodospirillum sp. A1_3_36 TaxID=3391666 RepID=UPI0039A4A653